MENDKSLILDLHDCLYILPAYLSPMSIKSNQIKSKSTEGKGFDLASIHNMESISYLSVGFYMHNKCIYQINRLELVTRGTPRRGREE